MKRSSCLIGTSFALPIVLLIGSGVSLALQAGDPAHGKTIFAKCQACHSVEAGVNKVGPSLHGIIDRASAVEANYSYSDAMKKANVQWTPETLDKYLTNPHKMVPGTKMAFPGLPKEQDRADVIAYLEQAAGKSQ